MNRIHLRWPRLATLLSVGSIVVALAACSSSHTPTAQLRAIHASADAPNVDLQVNGAVQASNLTYKSASTFFTVNEGTNRIQINPTGTTTSVIELSPYLNRDHRYTALVVGSAATNAPTGQQLTTVLIDDLANPPAMGNVKVRVVHGAPAVSAVDIYMTAPGAILPAEPTIPGLEFKSVAPASGAKALEVPAGTYEIRATLAGTQTVAFHSGPIALPENGDLLITAIPSSGVSPVSLLVAPVGASAYVVSDNRAAIRVAHFSPNTPAVDVFLKAPGSANSVDNRALQNLAFPAASSYLALVSGSYDASVALAGTLTGVLNLNGAALAANTSTSVLAIGLLNGTGAQALQLAAYADDRVPEAGQAKVRVIHLAPDAPAVDVVVLSAGAVAATPVSNLSYPSATAANLQLTPGTYTLAVVPHGATTPILPSPSGVTVMLQAGQIATIAATGCLNTATGPCAGGQPFALTVISDISDN
jgi:hypothetical protein